MRARSIIISLSYATLGFAALLSIISVALTASGSERADSIKHSSTGVSSLIFFDNGLSFQFHTPHISPDASGALAAPGLSEVTRKPGEPPIPVFSTFVALPPGKQAEVTVTKSQPIIHESIRIDPMVQYLSLPESELFPVTNVSDDRYRFNPAEKSELELENRLYPGYAFELSEPMYVRGIRVARLILYPVQYNPILKQVELTEDLDVKIEFQKAEDNNSRIAFATSSIDKSLISNLLLNNEQLHQWQLLPEVFVAEQNGWSPGSDTYKIEINSDGIYEISYEQLAAAGMTVSSVDPSYLEMMYRGEPVAYQFLGDQDSQFEPGERIRFYGWKFQGSRLERQFITNNIFWLRSSGTPSNISEISSVSGEPVHSLKTSVTTEPENMWFPGYTDGWDSFPNEPDAWYWDLMATNSQPLTRSYQVNLKNPASQGPSALYTVELSSRGVFNGPPVAHTANISMNNHTKGASFSWWDEQNLNINGEVPLSAVNNGLNYFTVTASSADIVYPNPSACTPCVALNRITVGYLQELVVTNEEITFTDDTAGTREFWVKGFSQPNTAQTIIWDVTEPRVPTSVLTDSVTIEGSGPYTYVFGTDHLANSRYIVTTAANILTPENITKYTMPDLTPDSGGAEWLAIAYRDLLTSTKRLASHREDAQFGGLTSHVVDIEDVINQYGYGLPLPGAIQNFLKHTRSNWETAPNYVLLVGDATRDPRHIRVDWTDEQYLPSDLVFVDPWQGQIPSDLIYSLLSGNDLLPDVSIGRLAVKDTKQLNAVIDKIIQYENNQLQSFAWMQNLVFIGDDADVGGNFCFVNQIASEKLPDSMNDIHLCLDDYTGTIQERGNALRDDIFTNINEIGTTIVNYRGHGAISNWGGSPVILSANDISAFDNASRPIVAITGDCLDGKFTSPPTQGLGESLLRAYDETGAGVAAAAHWGSSGLGLSSEHSRIIEAFYEGLYDNGLTALGDAVSYAKIRYSMLPGYAPSLLYSFVLQGDPAMQIMRPALRIQSSAGPKFVKEGDTIDIDISVENQGVYPSHAVVSQELPVGLGFVSASTSVPSTIEIAGNEITFDLQFGDGQRNKGIPRNGSVSISISAILDSSISSGKLSMASIVDGTGLEAWPGDEIDYSEIFVMKESSYLPLIVR